MSPLNRDLMKQDQKEISEAREKGKNGSSIFFTIPYGKTNIRILPPWEGSDGRPYLKVTMHFGFTGEDGSTRAYKCTKPTHDACPLCDQHQALVDAKRKEDADNIKPVKQYLYNVLDPNGDEKVLAAKPSQHDMIMAEILDDEGDLTSLGEEGAILQVTRQKVEPYCRVKVLKKGPCPQATVDKLKLRDLTTLYVENTPEELDRVLDGEDVNAEKLKTKREESRAAKTETTEEKPTEETPAEEEKPAPAPIKRLVPKTPPLRTQAPRPTTTSGVQAKAPATPTKRNDAPLVDPNEVARMKKMLG